MGLKALTLSPRNASLLRERAECRAKLGDAAGVVADLKKAAEFSPTDYPVDVALWRAAVEKARAGGGSMKADIALIQAEVSEIRGKPFKSDVESGDQSAAEFGEHVDASIDREMPKAKRNWRAFLFSRRMRRLWFASPRPINRASIDCWLAKTELQLSSPSMCR